MDTAFKYFLAGKLKKNDEEPSREEKLLEDIRALKREMDCAYLRFEYSDDEDLVEAAIYELEAIKHRYHRLIKIAKEENIESNDITACYEIERRYFG
mgnify:CR=1 FL=1